MTAHALDPTEAWPEMERISTSIRRARKPWTCSVCGRENSPGTTYHRQVYRTVDYKITVAKWCGTICDWEESLP